MFSTVSKPQNLKAKILNLGHYVYYKYAMNTGLYMLTPAENLTFNLLLAIVLYFVVTYFMVFSGAVSDYLTATA